MCVGLRHLIHDSRLIHLLNRYILNVLSLVELILLFNGPLTGNDLLPNLIWLCYLNLLRCIHNLLCTVGNKLCAKDVETVALAESRENGKGNKSKY